MPHNHKTSRAKRMTSRSSDPFPIPRFTQKNSRRDADRNGDRP